MRGFRAVLAFSVALACATSARAQDVADFYRGKTLTIYVGFSAGGGYDSYARLLARHLARHVPGNPSTVVQNMPGGGSVRLANFIYEAAPRDGTVIGTFARATPFAPLTGQAGANFDAARYSWIGSMTDETHVCIAASATGFEKLEDAKSRELVLAATIPSDDVSQVPKLLNGLFGTRFRVVTGYPGGTDMNLAIERGEVQGRCGLSWTTFKAGYRPWLDEKRVRVFLQVAMTKHADLPDTPLLPDLARNAEETQILKFFAARQLIARPFFGAPGAPVDRVAALREAFMKTMADPAFLAEAAKAEMEINPQDGAKVEALIREIYAMPKEIARRAEALAGQ